MIQITSGNNEDIKKLKNKSNALKILTCMVAVIEETALL